MPIKQIVVACGLLAGLSACGQTTGEQALLGGSVGAVGGAVVGANPLASAAVGAGGNVLYCEVNPGRCN
ncbi:hypothetical protein [Marinibacterium profundimaris]|uniref:YMGG-like Gly-zipper domain-containing protein n=1 Tax=Marinibacterium profundimaris TaxID=1679460 RepID=A0A225NH38_9RHOB|nr:hypothetical protein [Marinibacterium profundimaris]OWU72997.1 hypothetical protein ATO3_15095 [Marinibacterium profundimaris]